MSALHSDALEAAASDAFQRYAQAHAVMHRTGRGADAAAARRAYRQFVELFLTPEERRGLRVNGPALRRRT